MDKLENLLEAFDQYVLERGIAGPIAALARVRLIEGQEKFGDDWVRRGIEGNLKEAFEEQADLVNYEFFAHLCSDRAREPKVESKE